MDNFSIDITAEGDSSLAAAIGLAFSHHAPGKKAEAYRIVNTLDRDPSSPTGLTQNPKHGWPCLVLYWTKTGKEVVPFAYPMTLDETLTFVRGWLRNTPPPGPQPDHDGDNGHGWRVFNENWGHILGEFSAICAIQPRWAMYGK